MQAIDAAPVPYPATRHRRWGPGARVEPAAPVRDRPGQERSGADSGRFGIRAHAPHRGRLVDLIV